MCIFITFIRYVYFSHRTSNYLLGCDQRRKAMSQRALLVPEEPWKRLPVALPDCAPQEAYQRS